MFGANILLLEMVEVEGTMYFRTLFGVKVVAREFSAGGGQGTACGGDGSKQGDACQEVVMVWNTRML